MPYIIIALALVFAVTLVVAVDFIEVYLETQRSKYINFVGNPNDTFKWIEGISLDGFPVPEDYEALYLLTEFFQNSEEDKYLMEEFFPNEARRSMSRSRWDRAWDEDESDLACRKPHPARASKARK
jgi:hypothetical protein